MSLPSLRTVSAQAPIFVVMNAGSGDKDAQKRETTIREVLSQAERPHRLWLVSDPDQLSATARQAVELALQQQGIVVAAGGDGTINTRLVAFLSALMTLLSPHRHLVLTLEEGGEKQVMQTATLVVENNPLQLEEVGLSEASAVQQGELAAIVIRAKGVLQMLSVVARAALGRLGQADTVSTFSFTSLTVRPLRQRRVKIATDGEVSWLIPPLVFRVAPRPLLLMVPTPETKGGAS